jgi:hypothetical protein
MVFAFFCSICYSPRGEVGSCLSSPPCPARVSFTGCVLPSGPSPWGGLSPPPSITPDKTPQERVAVTRPPGSWFSHKRVGSSLVPFPGFPMCASLSVYLTSAVPMSGARWGFPSSPVLLFPYAQAFRLRRTLHIPAIPGALVWPSVYVKTLAIRNKLISKLYQHKRRAQSPLRPTGFSVYASSVLFASPSIPPQTQDSIRVGG